MGGGDAGYPPPPPPPPPPAASDPAAAEAAAKARREVRGRKGRRSTILTSPQGATLGAADTLGEGGDRPTTLGAIHTAAISSSLKKLNVPNSTLYA